MDMTYIDEYKAQLSIMDELLKNIRYISPEIFKAGMETCINNIRSYAPEAANWRVSDVVQKYIDVAEEDATTDNDPTKHIIAAREFLDEDAKKGEHNARLSLIMPKFYANKGDLKSCINELIKATSDTESGVLKQDVDRIYNLANMNHALNEAQRESSVSRMGVWLDEAKYYAPTLVDKLYVDFIYLNLAVFMDDDPDNPNIFWNMMRY